MSPSDDGHVIVYDTNHDGNQRVIKGFLLAVGALAFGGALSPSSVSGSPATPSLVRGTVTSVTIRYVAGQLANEPGGCNHVPLCRSELALSRLKRVRYGAWEARHLTARLNHLKWVGDSVYPCPLSLGNGYRLGLSHPRGSITVVFVAQSGCRFASAAGEVHASRWATSKLFGRLRQLLTARNEGSEAGRCPTGWTCAGGRGGPSVRIRLSSGTGPNMVRGTRWPPGKPVAVRFLQGLGQPRDWLATRYPAVTGLALRPSAHGSFAFTIPLAGACDFTAAVEASTGSGALHLVPRVMCHEEPAPNPPLESFAVTDGQYVRAIYARDHVSTRYSLPLTPGRPFTPPLNRRTAISIARRTADAGPRSIVTTRHGLTSVGPSGLWTDVWEAWVGSVRVPHWGQGHEIVTMVRDGQRGSFTKRGQILATWYAP